MKITSKANQNFMKLIRTVHGITTSDDIEKNRISQNNVGKILGTKSKEASYEEFEINGIPAEIVKTFRPHSQKKIILYCHGGGYFTGSLTYARLLTTKLALASSLDVLSFDYRLSPEYPYPAALEDAIAVWDYLMLQGYGSRDIIVAGDSAGGNLALALGLKIKEDKRMLPGGFVLFSPWTDLTFSGKSHFTKVDVDPILDNEYMDKARKAYTTEDLFESPLVSPIFGDYTEFPPVYIQVGNNEILLNDSINLHKLMIKQNVNCTIDIYKHMWHVFQMSNFTPANDAVDKAAQFIISLG